MRSISSDDLNRRGEDLTLALENRNQSGGELGGSSSKYGSITEFQSNVARPLEFSATASADAQSIRVIPGRYVYQGKSLKFSLTKTQTNLTNALTGIGEYGSRAMPTELGDDANIQTTFTKSPAGMNNVIILTAEHDEDDYYFSFTNSLSAGGFDGVAIATITFGIGNTLVENIIQHQVGGISINGAGPTILPPWYPVITYVGTDAEVRITPATIDNKLPKIGGVFINQPAAFLLKSVSTTDAGIIYVSHNGSAVDMFMGSTLPANSGSTYYIATHSYYVSNNAIFVSPYFNISFSTSVCAGNLFF